VGASKIKKKIKILKGEILEKQYNKLL